jgi:hypothetical protein
MKTIEVLGRPPGFNKCMNGNLEFWQREVSFTGLTSGSGATHLADRFRNYTSTVTGVIDVNRSTDVPSLSNSQYSLKIDVTTAQSSYTASEMSVFEQNLEGTFIRELYGKSIVVSFWVKSNVTGIFSVAMRNNAFNRSYIKEYTINAIDTWEPKFVVIPHELVGTWELGTTRGMLVCFGLCGGTNWQQAANQWNNVDATLSPNQTNFYSSTSNYINFSDIMIYEGRGLADGFYSMTGNPESELAVCQRYYEKSYSLSSYAGAVTYTGAIGTDINNMSNALRSVSWPVSFKIKKRAAPTVTCYAMDGTINSVSMNSGTVSTAVNNMGEYGFRTGAVETANSLRIQQFLHYTADSDY